jgi:hypothetical protein
MTNAKKKKLIATNAALWTVAILVSFTLPLVADSITEGRGSFLKAMAHVLPLLIAIPVSTNIISKSVGEPVD